MKKMLNSWGYTSKQMGDHQIVEDTGLSCHVVYNIIIAELRHEKLSPIWVPKVNT